MKRIWIAVAAATALGTASAQSSLTLFGVVDTSITYGSGSVSHVTRLGSSGYNSSRLGFRGSEDLGGGLSASFWLEAGVNTDNGTGAATNTNNQTTGAAPSGQAGGQGLMFNRRSTVSLAGTWGEVRLGRDFTVPFYQLTLFDPFGTVGVGTTQVLSSSRGGLVNVRASNSLTYWSPASLGGFNAQAQIWLGENPHDGSPTAKDGNGYALRAAYASGPLSVAIAGGRTQYASGDITTTNVGGSWDFRVAKLMAYHSRDRVDAPTFITGSGWLVGALVPVGPGQVRLAYSRYKDDLPGTNVDPATSKYAVGYVHNLSKRTALYTTYAHLANRNGAAQALNGSKTAAGQSSDGLDLGIRHSF